MRSLQIDSAKPTSHFRKEVVVTSKRLIFSFQKNIGFELFIPENILSRQADLLRVTEKPFDKLVNVSLEIKLVK